MLVSHPYTRFLFFLIDSVHKDMLAIVVKRAWPPEHLDNECRWKGESGHSIVTMTQN